MDMISIEYEFRFNKSFFIISMPKFVKRNIGRLFANLQNIAAVPFAVPASDSTANENTDQQIRNEGNFECKSTIIHASPEFSNDGNVNV